MRLFDDTEFFSSGTGGKKIFDVPDANLLLIDNFFSKEESDYYYTTLLYQTQWHEYEMPMYDKIVTAPRMVSWYKDEDLNKYKTVPDWPLEMQTIRQHVENQTHIRFNAVLLNL